MDSLFQALQQGELYGWLFIPSAIALGALHGLEPGHSKSLMAAFIVAVHGTVRQAILLGLAATVSHTAVVWLVALAGLYLSSHIDAHSSEPYFQVLSAALIFIIGLWMLWQLRRARAHRHDDHSHDHDHHDHEHDIQTRFRGRTVTTGQIVLFGLSGGLVPCPAAITVLLLCLQLKHFTLGVVLVLCFSVGLAITLVASGVVAAVGVRSALRRFRWMQVLMHKAPYVSVFIMMLIGLYMGAHGLLMLSAAH